MRKVFISIMAVAMLAMSSVGALALSEGDFIGKGEVQTALGLNNAELQAVAENVLVVATFETTWTCSRTNPQGKEIIQERETTTTTSATTVARNNRNDQVTGFWVGEVLDTETVGDEVGTCPSGSGADWSFDEDSVETGDTVYSFSLAS
jgi:hypothetical protein